MIMRIIHNLFHQITLLYIVKMAFIYFAEPDENEEEGVDYSKSSRAQLMAFVFLSSNDDRKFFFEMFNDQIMLMYIILAMYSFVRSRPALGVLFFSLAYGIKAGAILLIPSMLGLIQLNHGTIKLILSIIFIVGF